MKVSQYKLSERHQLHLNLTVVAFMYLPLAAMFATPISSLYLFATSSSPSNTTNKLLSNDTDELNVDWHGLGQSDAFFSQVITFHGGGILFISVILMAVPFLLSFRPLVVFNFLMLMASGTTYAMAYQPWVLQAGYTLQGVGFGMAEIMIVGYISVVSKQLMDENKTPTFSTKDRYLIASILVFRTLGWPIGLGISALMAQYKNSVDQFRWPGWVNAGIALLYLVMFLLLFRPVGKPTSQRKEKQEKTSSVKSVKNLLSLDKIKSLWTKIKKIKLLNVLLCLYLIFSIHLMASLITIPSTLVPPILSDHFGFDIEYISYFTLTVMMTSVSSSVIVITLKALRVNNRCLFGVVVIAGVCGTVLASDWQTLGRTDPCTLSNDTHYTLEEELSLSAQYELREVCLSQSSECYWNQDSQLSDTYCTLCRSVCRSEWMTINLIQFSVAVLLIHQSGIIGWTAIVSVATDCTPHSLQSAVAGLLIVMAGSSWLLTPIWSISIYDLLGKQTFAPMLVWTVLLCVSFAGLLLFYKHLGPRKQRN